MRSTTAPSSSPARAAALAAGENCSLVTVDDAAAVLGYDVLPPDAIARAAGSCFFDAQSVSKEGSASYTFVTPERLQQLRPYFALYVRRCKSVGPASPAAAGCALAGKLARVTDAETYYAVRTSAEGAEAISDLGTAAVRAEDVLYVRLGDVPFEVVVKRDGAFDLDRSERLARLILSRLGA